MQEKYFSAHVIKMTNLPIDVDLIKKEINEFLNPPIIENKILFRRLQLVDNLKDNGWQDPLGGYEHDNRISDDNPQTSFCTHSYKECRDRNFLNPDCLCGLKWNKPAFNEMKYTNKILNILEAKKSAVSIIPPLKIIPLHKDPLWKLHIPLEADDDTFFMVGETKKEINSYSLDCDGGYYYIDVRKYHGVCNMSNNPRIHIIADVDKP